MSPAAASGQPPKARLCTRVEVGGPVVSWVDYRHRVLERRNHDTSMGMALGNMDDAVARLSYAIQQEQHKKLCFLVGSGLSIPAAPSTPLLCERMYQELGMRTERTDPGSGAEYRQLADAMKRRRGVDGLPTLLRNLLDPEAIAGRTTPIESIAWTLPPQQENLARLIRILPAHRRGAVLTTNFDPLTEVALSRANVRATPVIASGETTVNLDALVESVPVVHLHGYWAHGASLNTDAELLAARPGVEDEVLRSIQDALVVVLGYGGWDDAFTRTFERNLINGRLATTGTEFIWMHHRSASVKRSPFLSRVSGTPQVIEYENVDFPTVVSRVAEEIERDDLRRGPGIRGLWPVSPVSLTASPSKSDLEQFLDGVEPSAQVCQTAPRLTGYDRLQRAMKSALDASGGDIFVVATGPTGEGKSVALRQLQSELAEDEDIKVLALQAGAPPLTPDAVNLLREQGKTVVVVIDEADLVLDSIAAAVRMAEGVGNRLVFLCAMHSQFKDKTEYWRRNVGEWFLIDFDGIEEQDSTALAAYWLANDLLPGRFTGAATERVAAMVWEAASTDIGASLYGSMLHLWDRDALLDRARSTLGRLAHRQVGGVSMSDVLLGVALADLAWEERYPEVGLTLAGLGAICSINSEDIVSVVLDPLGKEASLSRVGSTVFIRHPAVRDALLDTLGSDDRLRVCRMLGRAGGLLRRKRASQVDARALTGLSRRLEGNVALQTAESLMRASGLLESRVSYLATCRDEELPQAVSYARGLSSHLREFPDYRSATRGFLVEWSMHELVAGEPEKAVALCADALSDNHPGAPTVRTMRFALARLIVGCRWLANARIQKEIVAASAAILLRLESDQGSDFRLPPEVHLHRSKAVGSPHQQVFAFKVATQSLAARVHAERWSFQTFLRELSSRPNA